MTDLRHSGEVGQRLRVRDKGQGRAAALDDLVHGGVQLVGQVTQNAEYHEASQQRGQHVRDTDDGSVSVKYIQENQTKSSYAERSQSTFTS